MSPFQHLEAISVASAQQRAMPAAKARDHAVLRAISTPPELVAHRPPQHKRAPEVGSTVKHYELLRELGEGGMGTVYLARDTTLGRLVAIKVLQMQSGPNAERFLIEAQATARCRHDNIVRIHEVDEFHGYPYMVLEYLEGRTLCEWMAQRDPSSGPVSPSLAVELLLPVVRALSCAHQLGVVHRDLKPENIFLTEAGRVVVLDFGIAKRLEASKISAINATARRLARGAELTQEGVLLGTLPYMSPEQLRSEGVDARSDLWTVGILLYELVTGTHPLTYRSAFELMDIGESKEPMPSVRDKRPDVGALGAIIDRCLQKSRDKRYGSAEELVAALEALVLSGKARGIGGKARGIGEEASPLVRPLVFRPGHRPLAARAEVVAQVGPVKRDGLRAALTRPLDRAAQPWKASQEAEDFLGPDRAVREAADSTARRRAEQTAGEPVGVGKREGRLLVSVVALSERGWRRQPTMAGALATVSVVAVMVFLLSIGIPQQAARADRAVRAAQEARSVGSAVLHSDGQGTVDDHGAPISFRDHDSGIHDVAFSADTQHMVTAAGDSTAGVWRADGAGPSVAHDCAGARWWPPLLDKPQSKRRRLRRFASMNSRACATVDLVLG